VTQSEINEVYDRNPLLSFSIYPETQSARWENVFAFPLPLRPTVNVARRPVTGYIHRELIDKRRRH